MTEATPGTTIARQPAANENLVSGRTYRDNGHFVGPWIRLLEEAAARVVA